MFSSAAVLALVMTLVFGAPSFGAMTVPLWIMFGLGQVQTVAGVVKFVNKPQFKAWVETHKGVLPSPNAIQAAMAANGEYVIRVYPGNDHF